MTHEKIFTVTDNDTAARFASGTALVLATPCMIAWMENTALEMIPLEEGMSTVGTAINVQHLKASAVGEKIRCVAEIVEQEGRRTLFNIVCYNEQNEEIGKATHERFLINMAKFMAKFEKK
ncbi:MAG: thioesterase family protein [Paludibacteraceae bacterium]|nr:thioesterase family protein [Paludibacteraceae bacterium]